MGWLDAQQFADAIHAAGAPLQNCWGFIDGTLRPCCRPIRSQRVLFSGHKRVHGIKFQVRFIFALILAFMFVHSFSCLIQLKNM